MTASEAVPTPASTITGTEAFSIIIPRFHGFKIPIPDPINEASGMIATQPKSSSCLAIIGSSDV